MTMQGPGPQPVLKTPVDVMPRAQSPHKTGLLKMKVGSNHVIKEKKRGQPGESVTVRDRGQYPEAKMVVRCLKCRKDYKTEKEMVADHPTAAEMKEANEAHVWGFWSDEKDPVDQRVLGLLSDVEEN